MAAFAKITSRGQITLPASVRKRLALTKGQRVVFIEIGGELVLKAEGDVEVLFAAADRAGRSTRLSRKKALPDCSTDQEPPVEGSLLESPLTRTPSSPSSLSSGEILEVL